MMSDELKNELDGVLKAWGEAIVANDAEAIGRFATEDWVLVDPQGGAIDSRAFLEAVATGALTHDTFEVDVQRVFSYGDVAVAIAHVTNTGAYQGNAFSADEWSTDVFVRREGGWLCAVTALTPKATA